MVEILTEWAKFSFLYFLITIPVAIVFQASPKKLAVVSFCCLLSPLLVVIAFVFGALGARDHFEEILFIILLLPVWVLIMPSGYAGNSFPPSLARKKMQILTVVAVCGGVAVGVYYLSNPTPDPYEELWRAIIEHRSEDAIALIDSDKVDVHDKRAGDRFIAAIKYGEIDVINSFHDHGMYVFSLGNTRALSALVRSRENPRKLDTLLALLVLGYQLRDPITGYSTPFHLAAELGDQELLEFMIARGVDVNQRRNGETPLLGAADRDRIDTVDYLVSKGAKIVPEDLFRAARSGNSLFIHTYLEQGGDVNLELGKGKRMLHLGCERVDGKYGLVCELLLLGGADVNVTDNSGSTPLMSSIARAKQVSKTWYVQLMMDNGYKLDTKNNSGETALSLAVSKDFQNLVDILNGKL